MRKRLLVRLLVCFVVLLAADIAVQIGRHWVTRLAPAAAADWMTIGAALVLAAALAVCLAAGIVLLALAVRRGHWMSLQSTRTAAR